MNKETTSNLKPASTVPSVPHETATGPKDSTPAIRTATPEQFKKAHAKTSAQHAGLFKRLAQ